MMRRLRSSLLVLLVLLLAAPAPAQFGDLFGKLKKAKDVFTPWTPEQEQAIGEATAAKMINAFGLYENEEVLKYVNLAGNATARQAPRRLSYHFGILDTEIINAFALPGGYVFVTRGALANMKNEAELAGALAHEVAHVDGRHLESQVRTRKASSWAMEEGTSRIPAPDQLRNIAGEIFTEAINMSYSRDKEDEADRKGTEFLARAGYASTGLRDFLQTLAVAAEEAETKQSLGLWGKTHPPFNQRVAKLTKLAGEFGDGGQKLEERYLQNVTFEPASVAAAESASGGVPPAGGVNRVVSAAHTQAAAAPDATGAQSISLWVEREYNSWDNPLHSEVQINGQTINIYSSETSDPLGAQLKEGWNTFTLTTIPQEPANRNNGLIFRIGPMHKDPKRNQMTMVPVLWTFRNGTDWKFDTETQAYSHPLGPDVEQVTLVFRVYFAGLERENAKIKAGDYVLVGKPSYNSWNTPVTGTVWVNGTPLNTFMLEERTIVITDLLRPGKNEIKLVSERIRNSIRDNDVQFEILGPAEWNVTQNRYVLPRVLQFNSMQGWTRDPKSGQLVYRAKPGSDTIERVIPFFLKPAAVSATQ